MALQIDEKRLRQLLIETYGVDLDLLALDDGVEIRASDLEPGQGFLIRINFGWRSLQCDLIPENYSAMLIRAMGESGPDKRVLFNAIADSCLKEINTSPLMWINEVKVDPCNYLTWPQDWVSLKLSLTIMPLIFETMNQLEVENKVLEWGGRMLAMTLALLPLEETTREEEHEGLPEGALLRIEVNRYERSALNRQACILINGTSCKVCGTDFGQMYGEIGKGLIHIHHVVPVSMLGANYIVNPATDLVPVCPNCHAMLHKKSPPFTVRELRDIIYSTDSKDHSEAN